MVDVRSEPEFDFLTRVISSRRAYGVAAAVAAVIAAAGSAAAVFGSASGIAVAIGGAVVAAMFVYAWQREPEWVLARADSEAARAGTIEGDESGFRISGRNAAVVHWSDVVRVSVYKADRMTWDLICTSFELSDGRRVIVHEELVGWSRLMHDLPRRLAGVAEFNDWWPGVAFPAFATNLTVLWERETR